MKRYLLSFFVVFVLFSCSSSGSKVKIGDKYETPKGILTVKYVCDAQHMFEYNKDEILRYAKKGLQICRRASKLVVLDRVIDTTRYENVEYVKTSTNYVSQVLVEEGNRGRINRDDDKKTLRILTINFGLDRKSVV